MAIIRPLSAAQALAKLCDGDVFAVVLWDMQETGDVETGDRRESAKNALDSMGRVVQTVEKGGGSGGPFNEVLKDALVKGNGFGLYGIRHSAGKKDR